MSDTNIAILSKTINFAADKHKDQRRKDATKAPYINHPIAVMNFIANIGQVTDLSILQAAVLHDTVEDTNTTLDEIESLFGAAVANIVKEVTDDKKLPKAERKRLQVANASKKSYGAKIVKLADKLSNLRDLLSSKPESWTVERIHGYFTWAHYVTDEMRGTNEFLEAELEKVFGSSFTVGDQSYSCLPSYDPVALQGALERYYASFGNSTAD